MVSKKFNNIVSLIFLILQVHNVMSFWGKMVFFKISKIKKMCKNKNLKNTNTIKESHEVYSISLRFHYDLKTIT